jgi:hypothetical protein
MLLSTLARNKARRRRLIAALRTNPPAPVQVPEPRKSTPAVRRKG